MNDIQLRLDAAVEAARRAGEYLLSQPAFSVSHKASNDKPMHAKVLIRA